MLFSHPYWGVSTIHAPQPALLVGAFDLSIRAPAITILAGCRDATGAGGLSCSGAIWNLGSLIPLKNLGASWAPWTDWRC